MKQTAQLIGLIALLCLTILLFGNKWDGLSFGTYAVNWASMSGYENWHLVVNRTFNAYHPWRIDPLLSALVQPFHLQSDSLAIFVVSGSVFLCGNILLLLWLAGDRSLIFSIATSAILVLALSILFGQDLVLFQAIAWIPWLIVIVSYSFVGPQTYLHKLFCLVLVAAFAQTLATSANQLSLVCSFVVAIVAWRSAKYNGGVQSSPMGTLLIFTALFVPAAVCLANCPSPIWPDYPPLAHVVPDDGLPGVVQSLIGPEVPIQTIDRGLVKALFGKLSISLLFLVVLVGALRIHTENLAARDLLGALIVLVAALFWDTFLSDDLAQIGPLGTLARMMPHVILFSLVPLCAALALICFANLCVVGNRAMLGSAVLLLTTFCPNNNLYHALPKSAPSKFPADILISPSYHLARWINFDRSSYEDLKFKPIGKDVSIVGLDGKDQPTLNLAHDDKLDTRWASGHGHQSGDEGFMIKFPASISLRGIELNTGNFASDFPAGIEILNCPEGQSRGESLANYPSWQGAIHFTPNGFLYYGGQEEVRIVLPEAKQISCLVIKQIGKRDFDWSVAEINVAAQ